MDLLYYSLSYECFTSSSYKTRSIYEYTAACVSEEVENNPSRLLGGSFLFCVKWQSDSDRWSSLWVLKNSQRFTGGFGSKSKAPSLPHKAAPKYSSTTLIGWALLKHCELFSLDQRRRPGEGPRRQAKTQDARQGRYFGTGKYRLCKLFPVVPSANTSTAPV